MKLSLNWLNSLVDISDLSTEEIEERAVKAGFEIEEKIKIGSGTNLVAGKVIECHNHPVSDVFSPVEVNLVETFWNEFHIFFSYCFDGWFDKFIHLNEPLWFYHWLDNSLTTVMSTYVVAVVSNFH